MGPLKTAQTTHALNARKASTTMARIYNFSAGPAILPLEVLEEAQRDLVDFQGCGMSIMECSHRGKEYSAIHEEATANMAELMNVSDDQAVLFLQGGASTQFSMVPMNLLAADQCADYTNTGAWAKKAIKEAKLLGNVNIAADSTGISPSRMPTQDEIKTSDMAAYLHITSNETIEGIRWPEFPTADVPLVADMSSDILSRPLDASQFGLIYAGLQKNLGPAGCTLVVVNKAWAEQAPKTIPTMLRYSTHISKDSLYNTPPCFSIYMLCLVTRWLKREGLENIFARNERKAGKLYAAIDATDFYRGTADPAYRSTMNVTFRLPTEELEKKFIAEAATVGLKTLKGHRDVGGLRASIYNAFPEAGVDALIAFMQEFERTNG